MPFDIYFVVETFQGDQNDNILIQTDDASNVARLGRSSKVGTKAGRYIKLVKIVRVAKFFKQTAAIQNRREEIQ